MSRPVGTGESGAGSMLTTDHGCQGLKVEAFLSLTSHLQVVGGEEFPLLTC